ncbi:MAG: O-acetyl-ADP-ribose deacetylase [Gammaproteobacteria bacterium]|nr:O-acetyl-ADP-ribose deacetylase [Gammaproteobacteria bacterium]
MIKIVCADITTLDVDTIVNAANKSLLGGGGVDGAIHAAAGPELAEYCRTLDGCETGQAKLSPGFRLQPRRVVHTVGPVWQGGQHGEAGQLEQCYRNSMELALANDCRSIAFPAISTGVFGYPKQEAAVIALRQMTRYVSRFDRIIACCFTSADADLYRRVLTELEDAERGTRNSGP